MIQGIINRTPVVISATIDKTTEAVSATINNATEAVSARVQNVTITKPAPNTIGADHLKSEIDYNGIDSETWVFVAGGALDSENI